MRGDCSGGYVRAALEIFASTVLVLAIFAGIFFISTAVNSYEVCAEHDRALKHRTEAINVCRKMYPECVVSVEDIAAIQATYREIRKCAKPEVEG